MHHQHPPSPMDPGNNSRRVILDDQMVDLYDPPSIHYASLGVPQLSFQDSRFMEIVTASSQDAKP